MQADSVPPLASPPDDMQPVDSQRIQSAKTCILRSLFSRTPRRPWSSQTPPKPAPEPTPRPSQDPESLPDDKKSTVFYLAYGSNLSAETFRGRRGIHPISEMNVCVPSLKLTFDLPGLPYLEPCFANTARRDPEAESEPEPQPSRNDNGSGNDAAPDEKSPLLATTPSPRPDQYRKDAWHKPLVGVLYELTPADFAHVLATEGGGASYTDITVPCHPLDASSPTVPMHPTTPPVIGHTLFAPAEPPPKDPKQPHNGRRFRRPDPSYAQASRRYLKLIADGAEEHALPAEYREYLAQIRPYRATTAKQRLGTFVFSCVWLPLVAFIFMIQSMVVNSKGKSPAWMMRLTGMVFAAMWVSYDGFFKKLFGDGERTLGDD